MHRAVVASDRERGKVERDSLQGLARQPQGFRRDALRGREKEKGGDSRENSRAHAAAGHLFKFHREQRDRCVRSVLEERMELSELSELSEPNSKPTLGSVRSPCAFQCPYVHSPLRVVCPKSDCSLARSAPRFAFPYLMRAPAVTSRWTPKLIGAFSRALTANREAYRWIGAPFAASTPFSDLVR